MIIVGSIKLLDYKKRTYCSTFFTLQNDSEKTIQKYLEDVHMLYRTTNQDPN